MTFYGYRRPDGRVGVRNRVLILPASVCATDTARIIAQQVEGAISFNNQQGCSQVAPDQQFTMDVMAGYAANPNIYGTVVVSLGCENCQMDLVVKAIEERTNKPLKQVIIQEAGGTLAVNSVPGQGAEHILARRAINKEVHDRIYEITSRFEAHFHAVGEDVRQGNPSPGNKAGGITTLEEKSLGCIHKGGHSPINAVYDYAKQVESKQGLVIMDTPGNDPASVAAMVAGGAQVIVFSSGRGSPVGHPIAPVVKVTGNKITFANMEDNIDFCAAPLIYGEKTVEQLGTDLLNMVVETACGKQTKAEALGFVETAIARICNYV